MMNNTKCHFSPFDNFVNTIFQGMTNEMQLVWLCFLFSIISFLVYEIFTPPSDVFGFFVGWVVIVIINLLDFKPNNATTNRLYIFQKWITPIYAIITVTAIFYKLFSSILSPDMMYWMEAFVFLLTLSLFIPLYDNRSTQKLYYGVFGLLILSFLGYSFYQITNEKTQEGMDNITGLLPIPPSPTEYNYSLSSYYIMTAADCCMDSGNRTVSIDALKKVISSGARCLDLQIFSINNIPQVSFSSSTDNFHFIDINNYISFGDVMRTITTYAFQEATCSNYSDPLFLHLRVKSSNEDMYGNLTSVLSSYVNYMLNSQYNYTSVDPVNIPGMSLPRLRNKLIIIVDNTYPDILNYKPIMEYVNIISNKSFCQTMNYTEFINTPDIDTLINFNKSSLSVVLPNISTSVPPSLVSANISKTNSAGVQMSGIVFQNNEPSDTSFFTDAKYAFVLKPAELRSTPPAVYETTYQPIDPKPATTGVQGGLSITL
jgi:hypothetical protein